MAGGSAFAGKSLRNQVDVLNSQVMLLEQRVNALEAVPVIKTFLPDEPCIDDNFNGETDANEALVFRKFGWCGDARGSGIAPTNCEVTVIVEGQFVIQCTHVPAGALSYVVYGP